jgi:hypothetical protein
MSATRWVGVIAMAVLVATACGSARPVAQATAGAVTPRVVTPAPTAIPAQTPFVCPPDVCLPVASEARTSCPDVQAAPQFPPSSPSSRNLALVHLKGSQSVAVRDVTDINHPFTVSTPPVSGFATFVSASELADGFVRMSLSGSPQTVVVHCTEQGGYLAWSPDGTQAAYVIVANDFQSADFHLISSRADRKVATLPRIPWGVGCESPDCSWRVDSRLLYSPDGQYISLVQDWGGPELRIWKADGTLLKSIDSPSLENGDPTMSVWSGTSLYFRDNRGVDRWRNGVESVILPGVAWIKPKASPAGGQIVFELRDASGVPSVLILDTASGTTRVIARLRSGPAFLTSRYIWYSGERQCAAGDPYPCYAAASGTRISTTQTGTTYIYDLQTGVEIESVIAGPLDIWPHPA